MVDECRPGVRSKPEHDFGYQKVPVRLIIRMKAKLRSALHPAALDDGQPRAYAKAITQSGDFAKLR